MLYRIIEHYDTENDYIFDASNETMILSECFICLDLLLNEENPIMLKNQNLYCRRCHCNGYIHNECLKKWHRRNNSCPICRKEMIMSITITDIFIHHNPFVEFIYSSRFEDMISLTKKLILGSSLFCAVNIILMILNSELLYEEYEEI